MRTILAHVIGLVVGMIVVVIFSNIVYGGMEARPRWTTAIGVGVWLGIASFINNKSKKE